MPDPAPSFWRRIVTPRSGLLLLIVFVGGAVCVWRNTSGPVGAFKLGPAASKGTESRPAEPGVVGLERDQGLEADPLTARVSVDGHVGYILPNARGEFPRVYVAPEAAVEASVAFPGLAPGTGVTVEADDGGRLIGVASGRVTLDADRRASYRFHLPQYEGAHRVTLRYGNMRKIFEFWVGKEPPVVVRR